VLFNWRRPSQTGRGQQLQSRQAIQNGHEPAMPLMGVVDMVVDQVLTITVIIMTTEAIIDHQTGASPANMVVV